MKGLQRFADRHGRIIALLSLLAYIAFLYERRSLEALLGLVLAMVFVWGALASANDLPGAPLRKNRRILMAILWVAAFALFILAGLLATGSTKLF